VTGRRAMKAGRGTVGRLIAHRLGARIGSTFQGRVSGVTRAGLFVKLSETGADGLIPIRSLGTEYFNYDESRHALVGTRSGTMFQLGDVVDVRLVEAAPIAGALRFELLSSESGQSERRQFRPPRKSSKPHPGRSPERKRKPEKQKSGKGKKGRDKGKAKNKGKSRKGKAW